MLPWFWPLFLWPIFMAIIPIQHYLVQAVGLRGNVFWLPMLLVGSMLDFKGREIIASGLSVLNLCALGFAGGEYFLGVSVFVPENEVTKIVFDSNDIAGGHLRIPSTFTNAHSYGGAMVATIPWIFGVLVEKNTSNELMFSRKILLGSGLFSGLLGIFIAGPRLPIVLLSLLIASTFLSKRVSIGFLLVLMIFGTAISYLVLQSERLQRFTELQNLELVANRIAGSLDMSFMDVILDFPMGNGIGAGGTSLPFFVEQYLTQRVMLENEYARILLEQGIPGFLLTICFIFWIVGLKISKNDNAKLTKTMLKNYVLIMFFTAWIGIGLMSAIPGTALLFLGIGYCSFGASENILSSKVGPTQFSSIKIPAYQRGLARA